MIFRKNGVQAMEDYVQRAWRAKASLTGAEMYSGCCTLKTEHAKPIGFKLFKNDQDTCDHTNSNLSS